MRGFTLLESLIYIALFGLIMSGMLSGIWAFTESADRTQTQAFLETEGNFLMQKMQYDLQHAKNISEPIGIATTSELVLTSDGTGSDSDSGTYVELYLADTILMRTVGEISLPLSSNSVTISDLSFKRAGNGTSPGTTNPESIATSFQISATTSDGQVISQNFSSIEYLFP